MQAAYEGLIHGGGRHPVAVVFIHLPPNAVDVNVHPAKSEVRFAREWEVHHAVRVAIRETLVAAQLAPDWGLESQQRPTAGDSMPLQAPVLDWSRLSAAPPVAPAWNRFGADFREEEARPSVGASTTSSWSSPPETFDANKPISEQAILPTMEEAPEEKMRLRPLAQISNNAYILCEASDGLYIVCQHRAHERILADRAIAAAEREPVPSQRLVIPFTVEAGPRALVAIEEHASLVRELGFEVEAFGGNSLLVRAVPVLVANKDYEVAFSDLLDDLVNGAGGRDLEQRRRKLLTMLSCKNAIKAGDHLPFEQMQQLVTDLLEVPNPSICPHGQPILIRISTLELDKKFEREYASR